MNYTNLYINGCSFTKGHHLKEQDTWPVKLSKELDLKLHNHSQNGQSFQSIAFNSFMHLSKFDPKDTLVVIGLTWPPRYMVQIDDLTANMTPANILEVIEFEDKIFRGGNPMFYFTENYDEFKVKEEVKKNTNYNDILQKFNQYYHSLIANQSQDTLINNQKYNYLYTLITLQSYLIQKGFNYRFVSFQHPYEYREEVDDSILNQLNYSNFIDMYSFNDRYVEEGHSHPSADGCTFITNKLIEHLL